MEPGRGLVLPDHACDFFSGAEQFKSFVCALILLNGSALCPLAKLQQRIFIHPRSVTCKKIAHACPCHMLDGNNDPSLCEVVDNVCQLNHGQANTVSRSL